MTPIIQSMMMRLLPLAGGMGKAEGWRGGAMGPSLWGQFNSPEAAMEDLAATPDKKQTGTTDRIAEAFDALRNRAPSMANFGFPALEQPLGPPPGIPMGGMGGIGSDAAAAPAAPGLPMDLSSASAAPAAPMDIRPPAQTQEPLGFFMRNAMMQKDPETGAFLDQGLADKAMASPFKGLFG